MWVSDAYKSTIPNLRYRQAVIMSGVLLFEKKEQQQSKNIGHTLAVKETVQKMNSGPPQYEQTPQRNWLEIAKRKWSGASITGSGQFSVRLMDGRNIRLFETFESA